jgi:cytochrome c553
MRTNVLLFLVLVLLLTAGAAWAGPGAGMLNTNHDFTQGEFAAPVGLCTFCHTPHKATTQRLLWNHELPNQVYTWGDTTQTIGGTQLPNIGTSWTGPTRYCLSCHDGSVAFGSVYWFDKAQHLGAAKIPVANDAEDNMTHHPNKLIGFGGNLAGNHPVAVPYPYQQAKNTYNSTTTGNEVILGEFVADPSTSKIRLFNNTGGNQVVAGAAAGTTGIECSSCHDPHNGSTVEDKYFLRGKLTGSAGYICLKCHIK